MKITVTQKDIDLAKKKIANSLDNYCQNCPIAIAVKRKIRQEVMVDEDEILIMDGSRIYKTPSIVAKFIIKFDNKETVGPFSFELP